MPTWQLTKASQGICSDFDIYSSNLDPTPLAPGIPIIGKEEGGNGH